jgi:hypothetical protein
MWKRETSVPGHGDGSSKEPRAEGQKERSEFVRRKTDVGIMTENKKGKRVRGKEENKMNA